MLDTSRWGEFKISDLFTLERGKEASPKRVEDGSIPMVNEINTNNGIAKMGDSLNIIKGNSITISVNYAQNVFYQPHDFIASVNILVIRNDHLNEHNGKFIATELSKLHQKYDYISKISRDRLNNEIIKLPVTPSGTPDWDYMESYMKQIEEKAEKNLEAMRKVRTESRKIDTSKWGEFHLYDMPDIIEISMGNKFDKSKMTQFDPQVDFVGRSGLDNGVACSVDLVANKNGQKIKPYNAGDITIALGGSIGSCFIQQNDFYTSQNVCVLHFLQYVSVCAKRFLTTVIYASCHNYEAFIDELNRHIKTDFIIKLPATPTGAPDWNYMESYMRRIEEKTEKNLTGLIRVNTETN